MKNKKPNQAPTPPDSSSAPPRPPPYSFVPPPIPFYPTPPPPWCPWPIPPPGPPPHGFHIAMPPPHPTCPPPPADTLQPGQHIPPAPPPYGMWPPPGAYPLPHMLMGPIIPPPRPPSIVTQSNSQEKTQVSVTPPTNMAPNMSQVEPPPMSMSNPIVQPPPSPPGSNLNGSSDKTSQLPPPLRKRPVTRKSAARERDTSGDPEQTPTPSSKGSQARRVKSKKCKDVEEKITPVQDESEDNVVDEQKSPKKGIHMAETSEGEENNVPLPKLGSEPYVGLQFGSEDEAYEFYNAYAKEKGFSIRKSHIQRSRVDRSVISREYVCASQGSRSTNDRRYKGKIVRPRRETRVNCRAAVSIKRRSQKWVVDRFHKEHNHGLVDPTRAEKLRSHRKITSTTKTVIDALYKSRIGPSKIIDVLAKAASAENNVEIGALDLMKYMKKERKNNIVADLYCLLEYFQGIQALDPGFFYAVEVGENRSMRSIFWVDNRAREAYKQFGDVMIFDTPFQTNKDLFPFASFTGLNHHRQAVLFGCGFLADETMESYIWFFQTFLKVMCNKEPSSVVTVRDKAMMLAIEKVFPKVSHRFCMLHIEKNEIENLGEIFNMHPDFQSEYKKCIYSSHKPEEFESGWKTLVGKYGLKDNSWLNGMYDQRHYWVPVYLQNTFFAGMTTTRMDQGMNYFDGFMHDGTPLEEFIPQYELALKRRREEEADEDFMTMYTSAGSISKNPIEEQAARVYTRNVFTIFSQEFYESSGCITRKTGNDLASVYLVGKHDKDGEMNTVTFYSDNKSANCSCHMFELEGMLCRHVLKVFQEVNVLEIPPKYILKRWTMSARYVGLCNDEAGGGFQDPTVNIWTLKGTAIKFIELGATSSKRINKAISIIDDGMQQLSLVNISTSYSPPEDMDCNSFQGEKVNSSSSQEVEPNEAENHSAASKTKPDTIQIHKKKRKCSTCNRTGHYTSICPQESVIQSQISTSVTSTL